MFDDFVEVFVDLPHDLYLALLDLSLELCTLFLEILRVERQVAQIFDNHVTIFLKYIDYMIKRETLCTYLTLLCARIHGLNALLCTQHR